LYPPVVAGPLARQGREQTGKKHEKGGFQLPVEHGLAQAGDSKEEDHARQQAVPPAKGQPEEGSQT